MTFSLYYICGPADRNRRQDRALIILPFSANLTPVWLFFIYAVLHGRQHRPLPPSPIWRASVVIMIMMTNSQVIAYPASSTSNRAEGNATTEEMLSPPGWRPCHWKNSLL